MVYTNSSLVTYTKISPNKTSPRNHIIDTITIHCMAGNLSVENCGKLFANVSRQASSNYGIGTDGRIALYVEEKDRSWCSSNKANDHRAITIEVANDGGVETGWHISDNAMNSLIKLVADICKRNNIKKLKWSMNKADRVNHRNGCNMTVHRDFASKSCPGDYLYGKHSYIADEVNKLLNTKTTTSTPHTYTKLQFIKDIQKSINVKVDGVVGKETISKLVTLSKNKNYNHVSVKYLQKYLKALGYKVSVTGLFDNSTCMAIYAFQKKYKLSQDGIVGTNTWRKLLS